MKILQVNKYHYPRGGADRYYLDLGERLSAAGHEVAYFAMQHPKNLATPWAKYFVSRVSYNENVWRYVFKIPGRTLYSLEARRKFKRLLSDFKPEVIHIHNIYHQISPSILDVAAKAKIPVVMHLHDYKLVCPNHALFVKGHVCEQCLKGSYCPCVRQRCVKDSLTASCLAAIEMYFHHRLLHIYEKKIKFYLAPSLFLKNLLVKNGWPEDKIFVINNPFRADLPLVPNTNRKNYFLYYGRLSQEKGVDLIIQATADNPNLNLKIAGSGPKEVELRALAKQIDKEGRIEFLGWREGSDLAKLITQAQAVLIPSRWLENFPLAALEALSLGTPIIAANIGGLPEIINKENGLLVPPENATALGLAMTNIINKNQTWPPEEIKNTAQKFSPDKNTNAVISIYKKSRA